VRRAAKKARAKAAMDRGRETLGRVWDMSSSARNAWQGRPDIVPHLCLVRTPRVPIPPRTMGREITVASYNVHRWQGMNGRAKPDPARACFVISEMDFDVIALQEVIRPYEAEDDPLERLCDELGLHLAFAVSRLHRFGQLGNAILSRFPISAISVLDISHSRLEQRSALAAQFHGPHGNLGVVATHLSLVDRTRHRQVQALLEHPHLNSGPAVLVGDMNSWRKCKASRSLEEELHRHNNVAWPATFPAARPMLALDRIYARGADVMGVSTHDTRAARRASDHLPVAARVEVKEEAPLIAERD
jgi:endonuclease/exonuclease/phosphatase family metal-dependent hydrolase